MHESISGQVLGIDFGLRQIGVASTHTTTAIVSTVDVLPAKDGRLDAQKLKKLVDEWKPALWVVGLPINMDGSESELSSRARRFAHWLGQTTNLPVELIDERLTSREAKEIASAQGHGGDYRRRPVDALAACLILEQWLSERN